MSERLTDEELREVEAYLDRSGGGAADERMMGLLRRLVAGARMRHEPAATPLKYHGDALLDDSG